MSLSEVLSLGLQCVCWGAARLGAQAFSVHSPVPCPSANLPTSLMSHVFGAKEACIVLGRLLTRSFTCQSKLADLYSNFPASPPPNCACDQLHIGTALDRCVDTGIGHCRNVSQFFPHHSRLPHGSHKSNLQEVALGFRSNFWPPLRGWTSCTSGVHGHLPQYLGHSPSPAQSGYGLDK